jgi:hypothetical protein
MSWDVASVLKERGIPFVFSTGYNLTGVVPPHLAGSPIIAKPFNIEAVEMALRLAIARNQDAEHGHAAFCE